MDDSNSHFPPYSTCTSFSRHKKLIPTFSPETPTFHEKDRLIAKKQVPRQELFKKILFVNFRLNLQLCSEILAIN